MSTTHKKILSEADLLKTLAKLKLQKKKICHCHGTFDLMHAGHIKYLQKSRELGDVLVVSLTADSYVNKGPGRPVFNHQIRAENLAALECVSFVVINEDFTAEDIIKKIKPDLYIKGSDYLKPEDDITGNIKKEINAVSSVGGKIHFTNEITFSSSKLINNYFDVFSRETRDFLQKFSKDYSGQEIFDQIDSLRNLRVLIIGDAIIDEYHYVNSLGETGKGNALAAKYSHEEFFLGGSLAVANHVANFSKNVTLLTALGDKNNKEKIIKNNLEKNVKPIFFYFNDSPTLTKRRFVDNDLNKFFEIYFFGENPKFVGGEKQIINFLQKNLAKFDAVIVADFGNGFITQEMKKIISSKSKFLAVNTQLNSGNRGYNVITQYERADFISLNEPELRLATHNKNEDIKSLMPQVARKLAAKFITVTQGTKGAVMLNFDKKYFCSIPALSSRVIDRVGAGDAYLSLSSLCLAADLDFTIANFVGSVAAAMDVQIVCNREPIDNTNLKKFINTILK